MKLAMRSILTAAAVLAAIPAFPASRTEEAGGFKVVVNRANPVTSVTQNQLSGLFLKKTPWPSGTPVLPVDLPEDAAVRRAFTEAIHGRPVSAIKAYWQQKVFSGRGVPPPEESSDGAVIAYVRGNPGAVGYVSEGAAAGDLRVLPVTP